jgi:hypothetical protein
MTAVSFHCTLCTAINNRERRHAQRVFRPPLKLLNQLGPGIDDSHYNLRTERAMSTGCDRLSAITSFNDQPIWEASSRSSPFL